MSNSLELSANNGNLVDQAQTTLEQAYNITNLGLERASDFLWPKAKSATAVILRDFNRQTLGADLAFYIDDSDDLLNYYPQTAWDSFKSRISPRRIAFKFGALPYDQIRPVVYIPDSLSEKIQGQNLDEIVKSGVFLELAQITPFLHQQVTYREHGQFIGKIMAEALTLLDYYLITQEIEGNSSHNEGLTARVLSPIPSTFSDRQNAEFHPLNASFRKSSFIGGYLRYLRNAHQKEVDTTDQLRDFCLKTPIGKLLYLRGLYHEQAEHGDEQFSREANSISNLLKNEYEFRIPA